VFRQVTAVIDEGLGPQQALELPRFLSSTQTAADSQPETVLQIESGFAPAVLRRLEQIGHRFNAISLPGELRMGYGAAVMVQDGKVRAGGDPRRSGAGGAIK
jgi:gamma-glutamyltranspeptidase